MIQITPYDFQQADVADLATHNYTGAIVAETGAGKTVIGAETARRSGAPVKLIVAPQGTLEKVWRGTITGHTEDDPDSPNYGEWITGLDPEARVLRIDGSDKGKRAMDSIEWGEPGYYLMSPNIFTRWKPLHLRPDLMLVDEFHLLGNRERTGGQTIMAMSKSAGSRVGMSGTMWRNRFENAWTLARFLYPERSGSGDIADIAPNRWIDNFAATKADHFAPNGRRVTGELVEGRFAGLVPCWRQHFKRMECCEFHPEGFLHDLPAPIIIKESVELTSGQKKAITQLQRDYLAYLEVETAEWKAMPVELRKKRALVTKLPIVRETRLSQMTLAMPSLVPRPWKEKKQPVGSPDAVLQPGFVIAEDGLTKQAVDDHGIPLWDVIFAPDADSPKLDALVRIFEKVEEPIVAATNSKKFAEMAVNRLNAKKIRAFEWSSAASEKERAAALVDFKQGRYDIIVGVTEAIGTGIDGLQDASGVLVSLNKSRDLSAETQLEGRLDRRGQKRTEGVIHYEIIAEGSTDEDIIDDQLERRLKLNRSLRKELTKTKGVTAHGRR